MKRWRMFAWAAAAALAAASAGASAQDAQPAAAPAAGAVETVAPPVSNGSAPGGNLFPNTGPQVPAASRGSRVAGGRVGGRGKNGGRARDRTLEKADSDPLDVRVSYRRAKTLALANRPQLSEFLRRADVAPNDNERRAWLRQYYTGLFAEVRKIDRSPAFSAHVDLLSRVAAQRYNPQRRAVAGDEDLVNGRGRGNRR